MRARLAPLVVVALLWLAAPSFASAVEEFPLAEGTGRPLAIASDAQDRLWMTLDEDWAVGRYDPATGEWVVVGLAADRGRERFSLVAIVVDREGVVWALSARHVHRVDPGTLEAHASELPVEGRLPGDLALGPDGALWASFVTEDVLVRFDPDSSEARAVELEGERLGPLGMHATPSELFLTLTYAKTYARLDFETGAIEYGPRGIFNSPWGLMVEGDVLWVADHGVNSVVRHEMSTNRTERFPATRPVDSPYAAPATILRAPDGAIWFAEHNADRGARLDPRNRTLVEFQFLAGIHTSAAEIALTSDGVAWAPLSAYDRLARMEYAGEVPSFTVPERVSVPAGGRYAFPVDIAGEARLGTTDIDLRARYENGQVLVEPFRELPPGAYRLVVSEVNGQVALGRYVDVVVTAAEETPGPEVPVTLALAGFLAIVLRHASRGARRR